MRIPSGSMPTAMAAATLVLIAGCAQSSVESVQEQPSSAPASGEDGVPEINAGQANDLGTCDEFNFESLREAVPGLDELFLDHPSGVEGTYWCAMQYEEGYESKALAENGGEARFGNHIQLTVSEPSGGSDRNMSGEQVLLESGVPAYRSEPRSHEGYVDHVMSATTENGWTLMLSASVLENDATDSAEVDTAIAEVLDSAVRALQ